MNLQVDLNHIKLYEFIKELNIPSKSGYDCIKQINVYRIVVFWPFFVFVFGKITGDSMRGS